jgi:hypothetical protein
LLNTSLALSGQHSLPGIGTRLHTDELSCREWIACVHALGELDEGRTKRAGAMRRLTTIVFHHGQSCAEYHLCVGSWWIGTVSTLAGAVAGALLQFWRDRVAYRRQTSTRWDERLLLGLADYLEACDVSLRVLIRWRKARTADGREALAGEVTSTFEKVHEKSHVITLLTGGRSDPIRLGARQMRESLLPLCDEVLGGRHIDDASFETLVSDHRQARDVLVAAAQRSLSVQHGRTSAGSAPATPPIGRT